MLAKIHHAVESLLHEQGRIDNEVDVRFDAPTAKWIASLTRPTVNLFLFDVQENTEKRETNVQGRFTTMAKQSVVFRHVVSIALHGQRTLYGD